MNTRKLQGRTLLNGLLAAHGVIDLLRYAVVAGSKHFIPDFFVD